MADFAEQWRWDFHYSEARRAGVTVEEAVQSWLRAEAEQAEAK